MNILSYNCRVLGSSVKKDEIRELITKEKCDIVFIQETKLEKSVTTVKNANGRAGGIATFWNSNAITISSSWESEGCLIANGHWIEKGVDICLVNEQRQTSPLGLDSQHYQHLR